MADLTASLPIAGTSATLLIDGGADGGTFLLKNQTATASVFIAGTGSVTTTGAGRGWQWAPADGALSVVLRAGQKAYGIVTSTPQTLEALKVPSA